MGGEDEDGREKQEKKEEMDYGERKMGEEMIRKTRKNVESEKRMKIATEKEKLCWRRRVGSRDAVRRM